LAFKYRIERLLGEGSNGKTYLAIARNTGEHVAIKSLKLVQRENFKSFELFKREAETLASLHVNGVPRFYESILSDTIGGECYIVQEYIEGKSIQSFLDKGHVFSEAETLCVMAKTAAILSCLHTQYSPPVIHRDIKPSNILCRFNQFLDWQTVQIYLIDFGAVANARSNSDKSTIAGTIGYMAPEQNFGECMPQTDLYALGATALHMLTGVPPYEMDFDTYSMKYEKALDTYAPKTSEGMRELIGRLINYRYDKRPASALKLMQMISNVRANRKPTDYGSTPPSKTTAPQSTPEEHHTQRLQHYLSILEIPQSAPKQIGVAVGTLHNYSHAEMQNCSIETLVEYTFLVNGVTWGGLSTLPVLTYRSDYKYETHTPALKEPHATNHHTSSNSDCMSPLYILRAALERATQAEKHPIRKTIEFPCSCVILYHLNDPSCNRLLYIYPREAHA
ncbi:MAG: serine/threonine protein kinase, partial [Proteobacteria bacterium]|nr:serine/threonine protein kinase [Pseudomonadota bacterium]